MAKGKDEAPAAPAAEPTAPADDRELLIRIEHYHDEDPYAPQAYLRFNARMKLIAQEVQSWASIVLDSVTSMEIVARKYHQYKLNPTAKDGRQWYAGSKEALEDQLYTRMGAWRTNVGVAAHVDEDKDEVSGEMIRNPAAPGRLPKRLPAGYMELYHAYVSRAEDGKRHHALQTRNDGRYNASSQINAPEVCYPDWEELWAGWEVKRPRPWVHAIVYGDSGTGKSTFLATWPKPMLVLMFDPLGKDMPYHNVGELGAEYDDGGIFVQEIVRAEP